MEKDNNGRSCETPSTSDLGHFAPTVCQCPSTRKCLGSSLGIGVNPSSYQWVRREEDYDADEDAASENESDTEEERKTLDRDRITRKLSSDSSTLRIIGKSNNQLSPDEDLLTTNTSDFRLTQSQICICSGRSSGQSAPGKSSCQSSQGKLRQGKTKCKHTELFKTKTITINGEDHVIKVPMTAELGMALFKKLYHAKDRALANRLRTESNSSSSSSDGDSLLGSSFGSTSEGISQRMRSCSLGSLGNDDCDSGLGSSVGSRSSLASFDLSDYESDTGSIFMTELNH